MVGKLNTIDFSLVLCLYIKTIYISSLYDVNDDLKDKSYI